MRVAVVDGDVIGGGATSAGMGHIVVMDDSDAQFALTRYSQELWQELRAVFLRMSSTNRGELSGWRPTKKRWRKCAANILILRPTRRSG